MYTKEEQVFIVTAVLLEVFICFYDPCFSPAPMATYTGEETEMCLMLLYAWSSAKIQGEVLSPDKHWRPKILETVRIGLICKQ